MVHALSKLINRKYSNLKIKIILSSHQKLGCFWSSSSLNASELLAVVNLDVSKEGEIKTA